jgi:hypothetical protein
MRIEIVNIIPPRQEQKGNGTYQVLEVAYKNDAGKVQGKKLVSFNFPEVFDALSKANRGDIYDIEVVKDGKYWNWKGAAKSDGTTAAPAGEVSRPVGRVTGSNYETADERKHKQKLITRQASINAAIAFAEAVGDKKATPATITETAAFFENWVTRPDTPMEAVQKLQDDIPY